MNIKLIALDMDGTTLQRDGSLSNRNKEAIERALAKGIVVVPASGRVLQEMPKVVMNIKNIDYALTSNGASVTDIKQNKVIYTNFINNKKVLEVVKKLFNKEILVELYANGKPYAAKEQIENLPDFGVPKEFIKLMQKNRIPVENLAQYVEETELKIEKINLFFADLILREKIWKGLEKDEELMVTSSIPNNIEINALGSNKADGLAQLCAKLHIDKKNVMAIGDNLNDKEMISFAGCGVAMGNAIESIKAIADFTTLTRDEDGVAHAIEKFVFCE